MLNNPQTQILANLALSGVGLIPNRDGNVLFVDSFNGKDGNSGATPWEALASIAKAQTKCKSWRGDIIIAQEGHQEPFGSVNLSVNGIKVFGLGHAFRRPILTPNAAGQTITISGNGIQLHGLMLDGTGIDALAQVLNITAPDVVVRDCTVLVASSAAQAVLGINAADAAHRLLLSKCRILGTNNAGATAGIRVGGLTDCEISDCTITGSFGVAVGGIENLVAGLRHVILRNRIYNSTAASTKAVSMHASTTGFIGENQLQILSGAAPITAAAMSWAGANYYAAALGTAGTLI